MVSLFKQQRRGLGDLIELNALGWGFEVARKVVSFYGRCTFIVREHNWL